MEKNVMFLFLSFAAYTSAASISGSASLDPSQLAVGGQITFPKIPGINAPFFIFPGIFSSGSGRNPSSNIGSKSNINPYNSYGQVIESIPGLNNVVPNGKNDPFGIPEFYNIDDSASQNTNAQGNHGSNNSNNFPNPFLQFIGSIPVLSNLIPNANDKPSGIPGFPNVGNIFSQNPNSHGTNNENRNNTNDSNISFNPFNQFIESIPGLRNLVPNGNNGQVGIPGFPNIDDLVSHVPGIGGNSTFQIPQIPIPGVNGPYIPGVSEALQEAKEHLQAALNITSDISTGLRDAVQAALDSDHPADSISIILTTIAKVYSTVASHCPVIVVGRRVLHEGVRLAFEVVRSIRNVAVGTDNTSTFT